jgi:hypothetical protein
MFTIHKLINVDHISLFLFKQESSVMKEVPVVIMSSENVPTRINKYFQMMHFLFSYFHFTYVSLFQDLHFSDQVLRGRSSDVHAEAPKTIRCEEIEMSIDELWKLNTLMPKEIRTNI